MSNQEHTHGKYVGKITKIHEYHVDFEIRDSNDASTDEPDVTGTIKWDGCSNWQAGEHCQVHFCSAKDMDDFAAVFKAIYAEVPSVLQHADKDFF